MINIVVDGMEAVIKEDSEFEYVAENAQFSDSEGYSLSIEFPMEDCPENIKIFGHIHRDDVEKETALLGCMIVSGNFFRKGALAILETNEKSVKGQFLEGVDPENEEASADTVYVNEIDLGSPAFVNPSDISPEDARKGTASEVCLPWIPEGYDVVNNRAVSATQWHEETRRLTWQPYLLPLIAKVAQGAGYTLEMPTLQESYWNRAIVCNTIPPSWEMPDYCDAMPHWTVREFFQKLAPFLSGVFEFDETEKVIRFSFYSDFRDSAGTVAIGEVVDEYSCTVTRDEEDADFLPIKRFRYKASDNTVWKFLDAPWLRKKWLKSAEKVATVAELEAKRLSYSSGNTRGKPVILYCEELETYFIQRPVVIYSQGHVSEENAKKYPYAKFMEFQPLDVFGPAYYDPDDEDLGYEELEFVPAVVDYAMEGKMLWIPVGTYEESGGQLYDPQDPSAFEFWENGGNGPKLPNGGILSDNMSVRKPREVNIIESHEEGDGDGADFDRVYIGFVNPNVALMPYPLTDVDSFDGKIRATEKFMRLSEGGAGGTGAGIDPKVKYSFSFVADSIPDINARFMIHGQEYVCRKITATFGSRGMKPLLKGEFFRITTGSL